MSVVLHSSQRGKISCNQEIKSPFCCQPCMNRKVVLVYSSKVYPNGLHTGINLLSLFFRCSCKFIAFHTFNHPHCHQIWKPIKLQGRILIGDNDILHHQLTNGPLTRVPCDLLFLHASVHGAVGVAPSKIVLLSFTWTYPIPSVRQTSKRITYYLEHGSIITFLNCHVICISKVLFWCTKSNWIRMSVSALWY